jgi:hypothetical protein
VVDVSSDAGWAYLADEYTRGYDSPQFERIIDLMRGQGAASVVVEHRYIDMDYRSEHSRFYGTTFRRYPSVTHRLHFFAQSVATDLSNLGNLRAEYLGYSVMRPLSLSPVGRTMIGPPQELAAGVVTLVEERVHLFGHEFSISGVPFISQDAQYLRCAHAAQWMVLRHANLLRGTPRRLPGDIHDASLGGTVNGRQIPSDGLSIPQMLVGLTNLGLSPGPVFLPETREESIEKDHVGLFAIVCRYVNSQMPPIVISLVHAWVVVGYTQANTGVSHDTITLYRHDDALGPYIAVPDPWDEGESHTPWLLAIAPLPPKVYLSGERAEPIGQFALTQLGARDPEGAFNAALAEDRLSYRTYALTGSEFKASVRGRLPDDVAEMYAFAHLPNFVWVVEALDRDLVRAGKPAVLGEAVLDPTGYHEARPDHPIFDAVCMMNVCGVGLAMTPDHRSVTTVTVPDFTPYESYHAPNRRA